MQGKTRLFTLPDCFFYCFDIRKHYCLFPNTIFHLSSSSLIEFNISTWRKSGLASNPLFILPGFFLHFSLELSYGYLWFEGNGKIPLGRQGIWRGKEWALNRSTYILISTHICHKPRWQNWLGLHSANSMVVGSNPAACYSKFCYFFTLALPIFLLFPPFSLPSQRNFPISFKHKAAMARL